MSKNSRADETVLHSATSTGTSLRTTVPAFAISQLGLKKGDILRWQIDKEGDNLYLKLDDQKQRLTAYAIFFNRKYDHNLTEEFFGRGIIKK